MAEDCSPADSPSIRSLSAKEEASSSKVEKFTGHARRKIGPCVQWPGCRRDSQKSASCCERHSSLRSRRASRYSAAWRLVTPARCRRLANRFEPPRPRAPPRRPRRRRPPSGQSAPINQLESRLGGRDRGIADQPRTLEVEMHVENGATPRLGGAFDGDLAACIRSSLVQRSVPFP